MRRAITALGLLLAAILPTIHAELSPAEREARLAVIRGHMETDLATFEKNLGAPKPEPVVRDLSAAALAYMMSGNPARAQALVEQVFALQDMRPGSPDFGNVPWQQNHPEIDDPNSVKFTALTLAPLFLKYGAQFPASFQEEARPRLQAMLAAIQRKNVRVSYTNIFLMKAVTEILLGEYLSDAAAMAQGKAGLEEWMRFTRENGITEYTSAVYAGVQLSTLHTLANTAADAGAKALAETALAYLWTDAAANYFPGAEALSGSSSRTYSFLHHDLNINHLYYLYGFQPTAPGRIGELSAEVLGWANGAWNRYQPPADLLALSQQPIRLITQRTGSGPGQDRVNYITPSFSLGSSSFFYEHQDRQIAMHLASPKNLAALSVVLDPFNAPYGKVRVLETHGGHYKITHLRNGISAVQDRGALLALHDLSPEAAKRIGSSVATNVVFPLDVDGLYLDGKPVTWEKEAIPVTPESVLGLREGRAAVAVRLFHADGMMDGCPVYYLRNDGSRWKAGRLVAYHSRGNEDLRPGPALRSGVLILAAECATDEEFQKFLADAHSWKITSENQANLWAVSATGPSPNEAGAPLTLSASLDLQSKQTAERAVNGQPVKPGVFSLNGRDLAQAIWNRAPEPTAKDSAAPEKLTSQP